MTEPLAYLNGRTIAASEARLPIYDAGVVLGATVSEMSRTFRHRAYRLEDHLDRLFRSLKAARLDIGLSKDDLAAISHDLVAHNAKLLPEDGDLGIVQFATAGEVRTYAAMMDHPPRTTPTVCVHTFPLMFELYARRMQMGAHLVTPSVRQIPEACFDPHVKSRSRIHYYLADKEAREVDPEALALLLDLDGHVTETATANFLMVVRGVLVSPRLDQTLVGISRATVVDLAGRLGIPFRERDILLAEVCSADEALITSTPYCMLPVTRINSSRIGDGRPGPVFQRLVAAWSKEVDLDIVQQILGSGRRTGAVAGELEGLQTPVA
jgi:branched-subunit amino acid aminotransferase/4-amino-4-deoxychorismate lyase